MNLLYILSSGRSGSTLLELLLNTQKNIWTAGELHVLPWTLKDNSLCGCGKINNKCKFWTKVLDDQKSEYNLDLVSKFRDNRRGGKVIRLDIILDILSLWKYYDENLIYKYVHSNLKLFSAVHKEACKTRSNKIDFIVDSSKDPYRLHWLSKSDNIKIKTIFLVRDPRAFVFSMLKDRASRKLRTKARYAFKWLIQNALFLGMIHKNKAFYDFVIVSYEDLATQPKETISKISKWLGTDFDENRIENFRDTMNHAVAGNPMRWKSDKIRLDTKWKNNMTLVDNVLISAITLPLTRYLRQIGK